MKYPIKHVSYLLETTEGSNTIDANTQTYLFGELIHDECDFPEPVLSVTPYRNQDNQDVAKESLAQFSLQGKLTFFLTNGIPFYLALGQSVNTTPSYEQHVITGVYAAGSDKFDLPTFTLHVEIEKSTGGVISQNYFGCKAESLTVLCEKGAPIKCSLMFKALSIDSSDWSATTLTTAPVVPTGGTSKPYMFPKITFKRAGVEVGYVQQLSWTIQNDLMRILSAQSTTPQYFHTNFPKIRAGRNYLTTMTNILINSNDLADLVSQTSREFEIIMARTAGSDEISIKNNNQHVRAVRLITRDSVLISLIMARTATATITVKDSIGGSFYPTQS